MSLRAYLPDAGWRGPGAPFGEPWGQGLGALASYVRDSQWRGPGAPFGLGQDPTLSGPDYISPSDIFGIAGQAGPNAAGYGAGGSGSVSDFLQSFANQASTGTASLPTGAQAASAFGVPTWAWVVGGVGAALFFAGAFKGGRR